MFTEATRPTLTSVDMNLRDLGRQAGQRLLDLISAGPGSDPGGLVRLPTRLVERQSSRVLRRGDPEADETRRRPG